MFEKRKIWLGVSSALLATSAAGSSAQSPLEQQLSSMTINNSVVALASLGEGEGGEGEGGEGEGGSINLISDDPAFLSQLGLIRGHLWVGYQLYQQGHLEMAKSHMKHPGDELYAGLAPVFKARGLDGFAEELQALADAVNQELSAVQVDNAYLKLQQAIARNEMIADKSAKDVLLSISLMVRTAADEYAIGVKSGEVVNVHEYQDAYGFTEVALQRLDAISAEQQQAAKDDIEKTRQLLLELRELWPTIDPKGAVKGDASYLYGAAARIELAALNN